MVQEGGFTAEAQSEVLNSLGFGPSSAAALPVLEEIPVLTFLPHCASVSPMNTGAESLGSMSIPTRSCGEMSEENTHY